MIINIKYNLYNKSAKKAYTNENPQHCPANTDGESSTSETDSAFSHKINLNLPDRAK